MTSDSFEMGLPDKIDLQQTGADLVITRRWFGPQTLMMTAFVIFWGGFLFYWYRKALPGGDMFAVLFPLLHVGVGVWLTYFTLAGYVNKTIVRINYEKISRSSNKRSITYEVHALTHNGKSIKLVSYMESSEQVLFVEQEIEKYLGIKDKPVRGEISR